jgi:NADPH2 dehydrogenase
MEHGSYRRGKEKGISEVLFPSLYPPFHITVIELQFSYLRLSVYRILQLSHFITMATSSRLLQPLKVGSVQLQNRIALAPLTRFRSTAEHVPIPGLVDEYYAQRGSAPGTLLITEATLINPQGAQMPHAPGIWNQEQINSWKIVTEAVHKKGSKIFMQLWGLGRAGNEKLAKSRGYDVVSSWNEPFEGGATPRALREDEIFQYIKDYAQAAKNAIEAGFDGVEIHGANGYLIDQFTQDVCNKRSDGWGGSIEKRARFGIEVAKAVTAAIGAERTGIRLSPYSPFQGMKMADPIPTFTYLIGELKKLNMAYLHLTEPRVAGNDVIETTDKINWAVDAWGKENVTILAGAFNIDSAYEAADKEYKDYNIVIAFGRYFISTPDLVYRVQHKIPLNKYNRDTFYLRMKAEGYTDYPFSQEFLKAEKQSRI